MVTDECVGIAVMMIIVANVVVVMIVVACNSMNVTNALNKSRIVSVSGLTECTRVIGLRSNLVI